jgi:site-specific recombinase XerD
MSDNKFDPSTESVLSSENERLVDNNGGDDRESLSPSEVKGMYLNHRSSELTDATIRTNRYQLRRFVEWCDETGINDLRDLTGRTLHEYRVWLQDGIERPTLRSNLATVRMYLRFAEAIDAADEGLAETILMPSDSGARRTEMIEHERADELLAYLQKYQYATRDHALFKLLWRTGMRIGSVRSLDLRDYDSSEQFIEVHHRPDEGTTLKNGRSGQRHIALKDDTCLILDDYIKMNRLDKQDEHGREPLFTTKQGRPSVVTVRRTIYRLTRPCVYTGDCPHGRDQDDCEATQRFEGASKCPSSVSPHPVRRGSITHFLLSEVPEKVVSERMDVSTEVLDHHYDARTQEQKMRQRRKFLDDV